MANTAESRLTHAHSSTKATTSRLTAKISALRGATAPVTSGRLRVRCISLSISRSTNMLMAFAPPAASAPPSSVASMSHTGGRPRWATIMVGRVVISSSSMIRGLVNAT